MGKRKRRPISLLASIPKDIRQSILSRNLDEHESQLVEEGQVVAIKKSKHIPSYDELIAAVPRYDHILQVPLHLKKYFSQRHHYFSLYDSGCLLDSEGWYSVTPESIALQIAQRCRCGTVLDAFCGVGGNAIAFANTCERVIAMDVNPTRLAIARHNASIYGVQDRIEFILADYISFARNYRYLPSHPQQNSETSPSQIDVVFLSPPWGGPSYLTKFQSPTSNTSLNPNPQQAHPNSHRYSLSSLSPLSGDQLLTLTRNITHNIAFYLPRNTDMEEISSLARLGGGRGEAEREVREGGDTEEERGEEMEVELDGDEEGGGEEGGKGEEDDEKIEVEEEWMGNKLKALTCYFGGLVTGREHRF